MKPISRAGLASVALIFAVFVVPSFAAMTIIESDNTSLVTKVEPAGTKWTDKTNEGGYQYPMSFVKDKPSMASGGSALTSGYGFLYGPGTGAELTYTFSGQNSVSVGFLVHAQGQIAQIYVDNVLKATVDTESPSSIDYGGVAGVMREVCAATGLSSGSHTLRIRNTGTYSYSPSTAWDSNTTMYGGRGTQLVVDFIRTGDYAFATIQGTITDGSGSPIKNARLTLNTGIGPFIDGTGKTVNYTDGDGYYNITGLLAGTYTLTAKRGNLLDYTSAVTLAAGTTTVRNISFTSTVNITRPRLMAPTVVARGGTLVAEVSAPSNTTGWAMSLANQYKTIPLSVSTSYGATKIWNATKPGWQLTATIPAGTPQELWNLVVTNSGGTGTEYKSVKVVDTFDKSFYLVHMTDTHCDTRFVSNPDNDAKFATMLEEVDIINPTFIALGGDFCQSPGITQAYDERMVPMFLNNGNVPCFISRGNHESPVSQSQAFNDWFWQTMVGQLTYDVKMGPIRLFCHDVMIASSKTWLQSAFAASQADSSDKVRILEEHTTSGFSGTWAPSSQPYPTVLLYGHGHVDAYSTSAGYPQIETATSQNYRMRLVRFNRSGSGAWTLGTVGYNGGNGSMTTASSPTNPYIKRTFQGANDGTLYSNTATIKNDLAETFENARARFIMRKGSVSVTGGTLVDSYDSDDSSKTIVLVQVSATANQSRSCTVTTTPYAITASAGTGGSIAPSGSVALSAGGSQTFTITPSAGYDILDVLVDGASAGSVGTYVFAGVNSNHTISATFVPYVTSLSALKQYAAGTLVALRNVSVIYAPKSAAGTRTTAFFYVGEEQGLGGFRVNEAMVDSFTLGNQFTKIAGYARNPASKESYFELSGTPTLAADRAIRPIGLNNRDAVGDAHALRTAVRVWGKVRSVTSSSITISDGSNVAPIVVLLNGVSTPALDTTKTVLVTGLLNNDDTYGLVVYAQSVEAIP